MAEMPATGLAASAHPSTKLRILAASSAAALASFTAAAAKAASASALALSSASSSLASLPAHSVQRCRVQLVRGEVMRGVVCRLQEAGIKELVARGEQQGPAEMAGISCRAGPQHYSSYCVSA